MRVEQTVGVMVVLKVGTRAAMKAVTVVGKMVER